MLKNKIVFIIFAAALVLFVIGYFGLLYGCKNAIAPTEVKVNEALNDSDENNISNEGSLSEEVEDKAENKIEDRKIIAEPIENAKSRITKKPFGIELSPQNFPVSPERFRGFHTGTDFETYESEQGIDIPIYAICQGPLLLKKQATGYGGVIVQKCDIENEIVVVVYGHLKLSSIEKKIGDEYFSGEKIGILGKGYSAETDGERKHLHLSIHKGPDVNILGYVQNKKELEAWVDVEEYL